METWEKFWKPEKKLWVWNNSIVFICWHDTLISHSGKYIVAVNILVLIENKSVFGGIGCYYFLLFSKMSCKIMKTNCQFISNFLFVLNSSFVLSQSFHIFVFSLFLLAKILNYYNWGLEILSWILNILSAIFLYFAMKNLFKNDEKCSEKK